MLVNSLSLLLMLDPVEVSRSVISDRPSFRGTIGMMHTPLPRVGSPQSLRVALQSDFFVHRDLFCCEGPRSDLHRRYRTFFNLGWTPLRWMELQLGLEHSVNRNDREQENRQDPTQVYAMGDLRVGLKVVAPWWTKAWRAGLAQSLEMLSSPAPKRDGRFRYAFDFLLSYDFGEVKNNLPFRIAHSVGLIFDRSHRMFDWQQFDDRLSREVFRFGVGSHQDRLRTRVGVDLPLAFGKHHHWGLTPMLELQWDHSLQALATFDPNALGRGRGAVQMSASLSIHPVARVFVDVGYQRTLLQPGFAFGPKLAPWQLNLALGGSFDLNPNTRRASTPGRLAVQAR